MSSNNKRGPAPPLPVFRPNAHCKEVLTHSTPLLEKSADSGAQDALYEEANGPFEDGKGDHASQDAKDKQISCLRIFLILSIVSNVLLVGSMVGVYIVFGNSQGNCPVIPPVPAPTGKNFTCSFSGGSAPDKAAIKLGTNDTNSIDFCWYFPQFSSNDTKDVRYSVYMDNWYLNINEPIIPILQNASATSTLQISNLLAGLPHQFLVTAEANVPTPKSKATEGDGASSSLVRYSSPVLQTRTADLGGCGNLDDMTIYRGADPSALMSTIKGCLIGNIANRNNTNKCIVEKTKLSSPCAQCWVPELDCILNACIAKCVNPNSESCSQCVNAKCLPQVAECAGLPLWYFALKPASRNDLDDPSKIVASTPTVTTEVQPGLWGLLDLKDDDTGGGGGGLDNASRIIDVGGQFRLNFFQQ